MTRLCARFKIHVVASTLAIAVLLLAGELSLAEAQNNLRGGGARSSATAPAINNYGGIGTMRPTPFALPYQQSAYNAAQYANGGLGGTSPSSLLNSSLSGGGLGGLGGGLGGLGGGLGGSTGTGLTSTSYSNGNYLYNYGMAGNVPIYTGQGPNGVQTGGNLSGSGGGSSAALGGVNAVSGSSFGSQSLNGLSALGGGGLGGGYGGGLGMGGMGMGGMGMGGMGMGGMGSMGMGGMGGMSGMGGMGMGGMGGMSGMGGMGMGGMGGMGGGLGGLGGGMGGMRY